MKYLIGLMFFMLVNIASGATDCRVNGSDWTNVETQNLSVNADFIYRGRYNDSGKIVQYGMGFQCRQTTPGETVQIWTRFDPVRLAPSYAHFKSGLKVGLRGGVFHPSPVPSILVGNQPLANTMVLNQGHPYLVLASPPNGYIEISRGSKVFTYGVAIKVWKGSVKLKEFQTDVIVYARNSLSLNPSTCTINNNNPILVDFGSVDPLAVGGDISAGTPYRQSVALNYSCPDAGISSPIDIKLVGAASSFNSSALATTNPNLAAGLTRLSLLVAPGSSFRTSISNSSGSDTVLFTLFRKAGSLPAAGPFTASATLVMSVP